MFDQLVIKKRGGLPLAYRFTDDRSGKPVHLGVMIRNRHIRAMQKQIPEPRFQLLQDANKQYRIRLFFFSLINVDLQNQLIKGMFYDMQDYLWKEGRFPFPDVFYYCGGIPDGFSMMYLHFIELLKKKECKFLNYIMGFDKWNVYEVLAPNPDISRYLPETRLYTEIDTLKEMLNTHGMVYLEGCRGQKGQQVIRVKKKSPNRYEYRYTKKRLKVRTVSMTRLIKLLSNFFAGKPFIIQQAISLVDIGGRKVDMRSEMQRGGKGELIVTGICVRLGRVGSPITIHSSSYRLADFLTGGRTGFINISEEEITDFLFRIYSAVEAQYGPLGELGIDFALDTSGRLWFIECNSHPTKVSLMKAYDEQTVNQAFCNTLAYAQFLSCRKT